MPRLSERQDLLRTIENLLEMEIVFSDSLDNEAGTDVALLSDESEWDVDDMELDTLDESPHLEQFEESEVGSDLMDLYMCVLHTRYLNPREQINKSTNFVENYFLDLPPNGFRQLTCMNMESFNRLVHLIEDHPIFISPSGREQVPVPIQLAIALDRFGHNGNGVSYARSLLLWGVSEESIHNFMLRCMTALEDRLGNQITWPNQAERERISCEFSKKGFHHCVGLIDGTLLPLSQRPKYSGETYYDRKSRYSINAQVVCDDRRRIIFIFTGMSGSCHDFTCLKRSPLWGLMGSRSIFGQDEYLLGDSGYSPLPHLVPAYKGSREKDVEDFNACLAHARVINEHCIGVLKSRWHSLRELCTQLKCNHNNTHLVRWITCCAILHNYVLNQRDFWTEEDGPIVVDNPDENALTRDPITGNNLRWMGLSRRSQVQEACLQFNRQPGGLLCRTGS